MPRDKQTKGRLLVVDDNTDILEALERKLSARGFTVVTAPGAAGAVRALGAGEVDVVVTDIKMPGMDGTELIRYVRENLPDVGIVAITGYASIADAVEVVRAGAEEYLPKPFTDGELFGAVERVLARLAARRLVRQPFTPASLMRYGLIGQSKEMREIFQVIGKAAATNATVLITGESGTGKELVARAIHYASARASAPFVPVNCGAVPEELLESELFGYVKGAFTGATETRAGFFQTADGGSIFLDEVSETSPAMQVKLLRVLQDKEFYMVGSRRPQKADVRVMAATNKDLLALTHKKLFRDDLYYRLAVITVELPPLRARRDDILPLTNFFLRKYARELGRPTPALTDDVIRAFLDYSWPGNVRELENVVQRLVAMADADVIDTPDLPEVMRFRPAMEINLNQTLAEVEFSYIKSVLASVGGNKAKAARILGINRKTLAMKLRTAEKKVPKPE